MFPDIIIFGRVIGMYSVMALCGIFAGGINACIIADKCKYDYADMVIFILILSAGAIIGSHLLYALVNYKNIYFVIKNVTNIDSFNKLFISLNYILGGGVFYGGLIGGIITGCVLTKKNAKYKNFIDIVAVNIPLFHFFGRIGCFLGGCCYGIPGKYGFVYTNNPIVEANYVTRFPVQLLEALFNIFLFVLLYRFFKNNKYKNKLIYVYPAVYSIGRFFLEFLRGDKIRGIWLFLSTSQIISIFIVLIVLIKTCKFSGAGIKSDF